MKPKVSVCVITYNHEKFIAQALDSILEQNCDFDFEIILGIDKCPDKTLEICAEYADKYPNIIRLLSREENLGMGKNLIDTLNNCHGEYIAILEGDDYWTSNDKLQKQIDFLDQNKEFVMYFHDANIIYETKSHSPLFSTGRLIEGIIEAVIDTEKILSASIRIIHLASIVFRNEAYKKITFPEWFYSTPTCDLPLTVILSSFGKVYYKNDVHCIYRIHPGGITNRKFDFEILEKIKAEFYNINSYLNNKYLDAVKKGFKGRKASFYQSQISKSKLNGNFIQYNLNFIFLIFLKPYTPFSWRDLFWLWRRYFSKND